MGVDMLDRVSLASRMLVGVGMSVANASVIVRMQVEVPPAPAHQEPHGEQCDQQADDGLGAPLNRVRQIPAKEDHRDPESEQRSGVAQAPRKSQQCRAARTMAMIGQEQRGDSGEVIGIGRMPKPQQNGYQQRHDATTAEPSDPLIQSEHAVPSWLGTGFGRVER